MHGLQKTLTIVFLVTVVAFNGCASLETKLHSHRENRLRQVHNTASSPFVVRTGGLLNSPRSLERTPGEIISLRQAVLESGGIQKSKDIAFVQQPTTAVSLPVEGSENPDVNRASLLDIFSREAELNILFDADTRFEGRSFVSPFEGNDAKALLIEEIMAIKRVVPADSLDPNLDPDLDVVTLQQESIDQLLQRLIDLFGQFRSNNQAFADNAIALLRSQLSGLPTRAVESTPTSASIVGIETPSESILIGLTRANDRTRTYYFHPQLVYKSAIGDTELENGDFVFAIQASETSLLQQYEFKREFLVPVLGASDQFNSVNYKDYKTLAQIFDLYQRQIAEKGMIASGENISVLSRSLSGTSSSEIFYVPMGGDHAAGAIGSEFVESGRIRPGDSLIFTYASRSPLIISDLVKKLSAQQQELRLKHHPRRQQNQPTTTAGRYAKKAVGNLKYYATPVVQSVKSVFQ